MDVIHLLPDSVANQIAAGEVIQRPASCLKELVENSLDAGATYIQIILRDAGSTLLQVIDDGKGMSETDARMAFERHATSKIQQAADLFNLRTMGFRGEALASIAAVSHVELTTRRAEDELGTFLEIAGSKVIRQEPTQAPVGTSMKIKDLFFNVPARRRFLKTESTELRNLINDFYRITLVYPNIHFLLVNNDEVLLDLPAQSTKQRIESIFKAKHKGIAQQLVEVQAQTELVNISGFIGKPEGAQKNAPQYFFVNGRYMKHPYFHKAVMSAYAGMLTAEQNPSYFIYFDIAPEAIDVNIHPTKTEIKFADEQYIWPIVAAAVRKSLGKFHIAPSLDFDSPNTFELPSLPKDVASVHQPHVAVNTQYNPFQSQSSYKPDFQSTKNWEQLYERKIHETPSAIQSETTPLLTFSLSDQAAYQYNSKYIMLPSENGLMMIDQHRAHVCIQYKYFCEQISGQRGIMQQVLFPETIDLSAAETALLLSVQDDLRFAGFDISQLSKQSFSIDAVPAELNGQNAAQALMNILLGLADEAITTQQQREHTIALSLAEESAIRSGKKLTEIEIKDLVTRLFEVPEHHYTPDGRRVITILPNEEIERRFQ